MWVRKIAIYKAGVPAAVLNANLSTSVALASSAIGANGQIVNQVWVGDSITEGYLSSYSFPAQVNAVQPFSFQSQNQGVTGAKVSTTLAGTSPNKMADTVLLSQSYNSAASLNVAPTLLGVNDLGAGATAAAIYANLQTLWSDERAAGYKVVAMTLIDSPYNETTRAAINADIKSNTSLYDALVDLAADPTMGCNGCAANATYFNPDQLHPTTAGDTIIANDILAVIGTLGL